MVDTVDCADVKKNFDYQDAIKGVTAAVLYFADVVQFYSALSQDIKELADRLLPVFRALDSFSTYSRTVDKLADNQFIVVDHIPSEVVQKMDIEDINDQATEYFISDDQINKIRDACGLYDNRVFQQAVDSVIIGAYDLAIVGLIAVLDRELSQYSGQIKNVHFNPRIQAIWKKLEEKGELAINEMEDSDFFLFVAYQKAMDSFVENSDFLAPEPDYLNRHWIMHGRTNRVYTKLDCVKILNMIYGTIRLGKLAFLVPNIELKGRQD